MSDALADALRVEVPCSTRDAGVLADLARLRLRSVGRVPEDSDEDLVLRLRDPRVFGTFAEAALADTRLGEATRRALVEHAFDLLPLAMSEGEVFVVGARAPPKLLGLAAFLARAGDLTVLHLMHLVYAVFLDRSLVSGAPRRTRSAVLHDILRQADASERLRVLYGALHLASVPASEARIEFRKIHRTKALPGGVRQTLAVLAAAPDGGRAELTRLAQKEGLLPSGLDDQEAPAILANIPRLPEGLAALGRRYAARHADPQGTSST